MVPGIDLGSVLSLVAVLLQNFCGPLAEQLWSYIPCTVGRKHS